ncbi:SDR family oxidoreductase [Consotaella sp. CSK11QG-6]
MASSRGLGLGVAQAIAAEGARVLICGRSADALAANTEAINAAGRGRAEWVEADLSDEGFASRLLASAEAKLGGIDILVNNTGGPPPGTAAEMSPELLHQQFQVMVARIIETTTRAVPAMRASGWGRVLTIASSGVVQPIPNLALSNTLRSALVGFSKTLAREVAEDGVTVNVLLPGRISTDRLQQLDSANAERSGQTIEAVREANRKMIPAGRYGAVEEFGAVAAFLVSAPASYVTGSLVRCDGGAIVGV